MKIEPTDDPNMFIVVCKDSTYADKLLLMKELPHNGSKYPIINRDLKYFEPGHYGYLVTVTDPVVQ